MVAGDHDVPGPSSSAPTNVGPPPPSIVKTAAAAGPSSSAPTDVGYPPSVVKTAAAPAPSSSVPPNPPPAAVAPVTPELCGSKLKTLRSKVENLPKSIPLAKNTGSLAGYSGDPASLTEATPDLELWETWDPQLNALIPQAIPELSPLVTRGKYGLIGLVRFFEHLVEDRKLDAGLLDGKIGRILQAIDLYVLQVLLMPML